MRNWQLPSHLEPYREFIEGAYEGGDTTVEDLMEYDESCTAYIETEAMLDLLQRLYDAGRLK